MEEYQKEHIRNCLPRLLEDTLCNANLFAKLMKYKVLTWEDIDTIDSQKTQSGKAFAFYRIIQTRASGYSHLISALEATNQRGIAALLTLPDKAKRQLEIILEEDSGVPAILKRSRRVLEDIRFGTAVPSPLFTGRCDELEEIHDIFQKAHTAKNQNVAVIAQTISISGLGGIGKTQLTKQYVCKYSTYFSGNILWMNAESEEMLSGCFRRLATDKLGIPAKNADGLDKDITTIVDDVYTSFENSKVIVVFDNAERGSHMEKFLSPWPPGDNDKKSLPYILITSRDSDWEFDSSRLISLRGMKESDAIEFVRRGLKVTHELEDTNNLIKELVNRLQYFPLAIQQAISYINLEGRRHDYSIRQYLDDFETNQKNMLDSVVRSLIDVNQKTTFTTWAITLAKIQSDSKCGESAVHLLNCIAYLLSEEIAASMLANMLRKGCEKELFHAIDLLVRYSMVNSEHKQSVLSVHRLVQEVIRVELSISGQEEKILQCILQALKPSNEEHATLVYVDHAVSAWSFACRHSNLVQEFSQFPYHIVKAMALTGLRNSEALYFGSGKMGLQLLSTFLSFSDPTRLLLDYQMCDILRCQCKFQESLEMLKGIVERWESSGIVPSQYLVDGRKLMAIVNFDQRKIDCALELSLEVLELGKCVLGWETDGKTDSLRIAAACFKDTGNFETSTEHIDQAINVSIATHCCDNEVTARMMQCKALLISDMGNISAGIAILRELSRWELSVYLRNMIDYNLAYYLGRIGKYEQALSICEDVINRFTIDYEESSSSGIHNLQMNKGYFLLCQNLVLSVKLLREVYSYYIQVYGDGSLKALLTKLNLAMALYSKEKTDEALFTAESTILLLQNMLGKEHQLTTISHIDLATILEQSGEFQKCAQILEDVKKTLLDRFGNSHSDMSKIVEIMERINLNSTTNDQN